MPGEANEIADLLARVALGDRTSFARLYERTSAKLFSVCLRILRDRVEAEDALQEVYVRVWRGASGFRSDRASPMTWLIAVARHHSIDRLRARPAQEGELEEADGVADPGPDPETMAAGRSEWQRIARCMDELPADRANAVAAAYVEGRAYQELAERHGVPLNTMRTWLRRSLASLRECLEREAR